MVVNAHHLPVISEGAVISDDVFTDTPENLTANESTPLTPPFVRHKRRSSSQSSMSFLPDDFFVTEKLGLVSFSILVFYNVSGGPFGVEASVRAGTKDEENVRFSVPPFSFFIISLSLFR